MYKMIKYISKKIDDLPPDLEVNFDQNLLS
jgi:hypothetical protein